MEYVYDYLDETSQYQIGLVSKYFGQRYQLVVIKRDRLYLLELENELYQLNNFPIKKFTKGKIRENLVEFMLAVCESYDLDMHIFGLAVTYLDFWLDFSKIWSGEIHPFCPNEYNQLMTSTCVCLHIASEILISVNLSADECLLLCHVNIKEFIEMEIELVKGLDGILIRPSHIFLTNPDDDKQIRLAILCYSMTELTVYKPSVIIQCINYLIKGTNICSIEEIATPCQIIIANVERMSLSNQSTLNKMATQCKNDIIYVPDYILGKEYTITNKYSLPNEWNSNQFLITNIIGEGITGKVYKFNYCNNDYAMKIISFESDWYDFVKAILELSILKKLSNCSNIITLSNYHIYADRVELYFPCYGRNVYQILETDSLPKDKMKGFLIDITKAVYYCHLNHIIHRDIKPQNIIYDGFSMYLIDFGNSVAYYPYTNSLSPNLASTESHRAPEALLGDPYYDYKIDIWAMGMTFYQMITGNFRTFTIDLDDILDTIFELFGTPTEETWPGITLYPKWKPYFYYDPQTEYLQNQLGEFYDLVMMCFVLNPAKRISAGRLLDLLI
jgi:hypothetical protein